MESLPSSARRKVNLAHHAPRVALAGTEERAALVAARAALALSPIRWSNLAQRAALPAPLASTQGRQSNRAGRVRLVGLLIDRTSLEQPTAALVLLAITAHRRKSRVKRVQQASTVLRCTAPTALCVVACAVVM
jgi:hypothetical protein